VLAVHLKGEVRIGLYALLDGDKCSWLAADFDGPEAMFDALMSGETTAVFGVGGLRHLTVQNTRVLGGKAIVVGIEGARLELAIAVAAAVGPFSGSDARVRRAAVRASAGRKPHPSIPR